MLTRTTIDIPAYTCLANLEEAVNEHVLGVPVRFAVTQLSGAQWRCEVDVLADHRIPSIFSFKRRTSVSTDAFNAVLLVPTGIGAEIGGHAGDATPVAKMLATACDTLILHPNVVNASDINEMPENSLYVEGSVIARLLMGTIGLQPARANRLLVVLDSRSPFYDAAVNSVNAARAVYGLTATVRSIDSLILKATYSRSGSAGGKIEGLASLFAAIRQHQCDAIAISSIIDVPCEWHTNYFLGGMVNPWGGVEAMLTHALSGITNRPTAHAPMVESHEVANIDPGIVDPRMAAEAVSVAFLQCVLKGLHRSPAITDGAGLTVEDVDVLVIPDGCIGLPTLAALEQGITVIAVRENKNLMRNDLTALPWAAGQLHIVENYWEAAGVIAAMKAGIAPESVRRPMQLAELVKEPAQHGGLS